MGFKITKWSPGGKLIFIATILAVVSIFMTWIDIDGVKISGLEQKAYIYLVFYIYPLYKLLRNQPIHNVAGKLSSILAIAFGAMILGSISQNELGETINTGGLGLYLYITASIILNIGTVKYEVAKENLEK